MGNLIEVVSIFGTWDLVHKGWRSEGLNIEFVLMPLQ